MPGFEKTGYGDRPLGDFHRLNGPETAGSVSAPSTPRRSWLEAALWMALLGPFFFLVYGACNWVSSQREAVPSFLWEWERRIPFVPIFIMPYMSIDLLFAASVFLCQHPSRIAHGRRADVLRDQRLGHLFPAFSASLCISPANRRGLAGRLIFAPLSANDMPFNLAPSLHDQLARHSPGPSMAAALAGLAPAKRRQDLVHSDRTLDAPGLAAPLHRKCRRRLRDGLDHLLRLSPIAPAGPSIHRSAMLFPRKLGAGPISYLLPPCWLSLKTALPCHTGCGSSGQPWHWDSP